MHWTRSFVRGSFLTTVGVITLLCFIDTLSKPVIAAPPVDNPAMLFLKQSMDKYKSLDSFEADYHWAESFGPGSEIAGTRMFTYAKPNKWKLVTTMDKGLKQNGTMVVTSVCDGKSVSEYYSKIATAMTFTAPETLSQNSGMLLNHPMFGGTLLYAFFGGAENIAQLVDTTKAKVRFGSEVTMEGHPCKTVKFYAKGIFGSTEVMIGADDLLIRCIRYYSEPLVADMKKSKSNPKMPASMITTERYPEIKINQTIADTVFDTKIPQGKTAMEAPWSDSKPPVPPVALGQPAPDFDVSTLAGAKTTLSSFKGKVVMIDFWATWCPPCRKSLPETQKLSMSYADKGLVVMAISDEEKATVQPFLTKLKYSFPTYLDTTKGANTAYKIDAIPTKAIIDRAGNLSAFLVGLQDPQTVLDALKKAGLEP